MDRSSGSAGWRGGVEQGLGKAWVIAVSGGGDSVGLLRVVHRLAGPLGLRLSVAHLDHGVRGEEARADAAFVAALAGSLGLPFVLGAWRPTRSGHFESDARRARYDWLTEVARVQGASVIAVGHTRDDQAETILHRIVRGTGLRGLAGIPSRRVLVFKPATHAGAPAAGRIPSRGSRVSGGTQAAVSRGRVQRRSIANPRPDPARPAPQAGGGI